MSNKEKILIVDNNSANIQIAANILKDDFNIWYAKSGEKAIKKVQEESYDLILLDVMMPGIDGFETSKRVKELPKYEQVPIIFVTAKSSDEDILDGFYSGGVDYVMKPYRAIELKARVQTHLKLKDLRDNLELQVKEETAKRVHQEKILMQQSRLASMGEMMDVVAHQWSQPISVIKLLIDMLDLEYDRGIVNEAFIEKFQKKSLLQIQHMVNTLNDFRSFFRPSQNRVDFSALDMVKKFYYL